MLLVTSIFREVQQRLSEWVWKMMISVAHMVPILLFANPEQINHRDIVPNVVPMEAVPVGGRIVGATTVAPVAEVIPAGDPNWEFKAMGNAQK